MPELCEAAPPPDRLPLTSAPISGLRRRVAMGQRRTLTRRPRVTVQELAPSRRGETEGAAHPTVRQEGARAGERSKVRGGLHPRGREPTTHRLWRLTAK